ncbi:MAG: (2Fe-2S)-binding protein [Bacteriovoracaceae bacterium]|nr:(2Fe-2S)-binding protein [Bacteriovoracaceae bacterium]
MPKVTVWPVEKVLEVEAGSKLMTVLKEGGFYIKSSCGGCASCSDCVVVIKRGEDNLSRPEFPELRLLGNVFHITKERLSCQTTVNGDVIVDIARHLKNADQIKAEEMNNKKHKDQVLKVKKKDQVEKDRVQKEIQRQQERKESIEKKDKFAGLKRPKPFKTDD